MEIVGAEVAGRIAVGAVVVVPRLAHHLQGHRHTEHRSYTGGNRGRKFSKTTQSIGNRCHTETNPDGKGIERTSIGVVALTRLLGRLVEVEHDGQPRHEEEEEHDPELLHTTLPAIGLPEEAEQSEEEGEHVEDIVPLVVLQHVGQL